MRDRIERRLSYKSRSLLVHFTRPRTCRTEAVNEKVKYTVVRYMNKPTQLMSSVEAGDNRVKQV